MSAPKTAADCYAWLSPEDVLRHALAAFYAACRYHDRGPAILAADGRRQFADDLAEIFAHRLHEQGFKLRFSEFAGAASETLAWWLTDTPSSSGVTRLDIHRRASHNENG